MTCLVSSVLLLAETAFVEGFSNHEEGTIDNAALQRRLFINYCARSAEVFFLSQHELVCGILRQRQYLQS